MPQRRRRIVVDGPSATGPAHGRLIPLKLRPGARRVLPPAVAVPQPAATEGACAEPGRAKSKICQEALSVLSLGGIAKSRGVGAGCEGSEWEYTFAIGEHAAAFFVNVEETRCRSQSFEPAEASVATEFAGRA